MRLVARVGAVPVVVALPALCFQLAVEWGSGSYGGSLLFVHLLVVVVAGLAGSYSLHEAGHLLAARRWYPAGTQAAWQLTALRVSLLTRGVPPARGARALVAVAGPLPCVVLGAVMAVVSAPTWLWAWYLCHGVFLLPVFGDGITVWRYLLRSLRVSSAREAGDGHGPSR
ncbi:hypothetical protein D4740_10935 [Actinomyces sp. 2119]|uniref:hypothetical protein n=1 Tax=Actinomyces sp. 2119 TaxID=2321393 RepID=UPI000FF2960F|nr:hypothetical protein [Actinomyces sp. 2119]RJF40677.1 hypothetical protein D4740_10935 [Actinomyces sp. 2119]